MIVRNKKNYDCHYYEEAHLRAALRDLQQALAFDVASDSDQHLDDACRVLGLRV